jgi:hypothetical protein
MWVDARSYSGRIFLSTDGTGPDLNPLPRGADLLYVPRSEHLNEHRRRLFMDDFKVMDVRSSAQLIVERIGKVHAELTRKSTALSKDDLISHAKFLFNSNCQPPQVLWVYTQSGELELASGTFTTPIQVDEASLPVPVLHQDYTLWEPTGGRKLLEWIANSFDMPRVPRLVRSEDGQAYSLSPEMKFLAEKVDSFQFLKVLQRNWLLHYRKWLSKESSHFQQNILDDISSTRIRCQDLTKPHLKETIFPVVELELPHSLVSLPLLPIPNAEAIPLRWAFLEDLGVQLQPTVEDCLRCLRKLKLRGTDGKTPAETTASNGRIIGNARSIMVQATASIYKLLRDRARNYKERAVIRSVVTFFTPFLYMC